MDTEATDMEVMATASWSWPPRSRRPWPRSWARRTWTRAWAWTRQLERWALEPWPLAWPGTLVARPLVWIRSWCLLAVDARRIYLGLLLRVAGLTAQQ